MIAILPPEKSWGYDRATSAAGRKLNDCGWPMAKAEVGKPGEPGWEKRCYGAAYPAINRGARARKGHEWPSVRCVERVNASLQGALCAKAHPMGRVAR